MKNVLNQCIEKIVLQDKKKIRVMIYPNLLLIYKLIKIYEGIVLIAFFVTHDFAYEFNSI